MHEIVCDGLQEKKLIRAEILLGKALIYDRNRNIQQKLASIKANLDYNYTYIPALIITIF